MRFNLASIILATAAATTAKAAPQMSCLFRETTSMDEVAEVIRFAAAHKDSCDVQDCARVLAGSSCSSRVMETGDRNMVQECFGGITEKMCACSACIPSLPTFLASKGLCA